MGICGSIAAYKALDVIRGLRAFGVDIVPIMTKAAEAFVTPLAVGTLAETEPFTESSALSLMPHIALARRADLMILCPASADTIAKCRMGSTDTLLTATWSAFAGPKLVVPAMHTQMYLNPATQENLAWLSGHGVRVLGPVSGALACGDQGLGRMVAPDLIVSAVMAMLGEDPNVRTWFSGKKMVITAGGTREALDPVRYLGNRSSGQMGHALAALAAFYGAHVTLISTVGVCDDIPGVSVISVDTVLEMGIAMDAAVGDADVLVMAAAVSDFTLTPADTKIKRGDTLTVSLQPTVDLLATVKRPPGLRVVGFCLEDHDLVGVGKAKMAAKHTDVMVCNRSDVFGAAHREVTILTASGGHTHVQGSVSDVAQAILAHIAGLG